MDTSVNNYRTWHVFDIQGFMPVPVICKFHEDPVKSEEAMHSHDHFPIMGQFGCHNNLSSQTDCVKSVCPQSKVMLMTRCA